MLTVREFIAALRSQRIIAIVRSSSRDEAVAAGRRLIDAGLGVVEVSLNTPDSLDAIAALRHVARDRPGTLIGAGTVLTAEWAHRAADAGAQFYVAPILDPSTLAAAQERGIPAVPGCATPTEMWQANLAGAAAIKLFPATEWTPAGLANLLRAMPSLNVVPTGGISAENAEAWLQAGAIALGIGSGLDSPDLLRRLAPFVQERYPGGAA
jgi:2-dehydro-3-deoxyphosphogluconate aldolase/(4S)-4-hydroxy-2-oxoglutarate aldolase